MSGVIGCRARATWDQDKVLAGRASRRGLQLELVFDGQEKEGAERRQLQLALVIDRSGSMEGARLDAAKEAALGLVDRLQEGDRLSLVAFDDQVDVMLQGVEIGDASRARAREMIRCLSARGCTDLAAGWLAGARAIDESLLRFRGDIEQVLVLSDGKANRGITDPGELLEMARGFYARGIGTSCIGVGADYSALQLDALAEGGCGRLNQCSEAGEIVETVLGELGGLRREVVRDVTVELELGDARVRRIRSLTSDRFESRATGGIVRLGSMALGARRQAAFLVDLEALADGDLVQGKLTIRWRDPEEEKLDGILVLDVSLEAIASDLAGFVIRDLAVLRSIAELWTARVIYEAMRANEAGNYLLAGELCAQARMELEAFLGDASWAQSFYRRLYEAERRSSRSWRGVVQKEAYTAVKKFAKGEADWRARRRSWSEYFE